MRIAMIGSKGIPASLAQGGGIETHVEELSVRLAERGHEVTVYVRTYANPANATQYKGVRLVTLPSIRLKHLDTITHVFLSSIHVLFTRASIIHYHAVGPSTLSCIPRIFTPWKRVVVTFHSRDRFHEKWGWIARAYLAYGEWTAVRFPHATIAISHALKLFCKRKFGTDVWYIPNGAEIPKIQQGSDMLKKFGLEPGKYFFTLSRLLPLKAIEDAILAFQKVDTEMKLVILGNASFDTIEYEQMLQGLARKDPRVLMLGRRIGKELQQLISNAYAMIHPSRVEGLSVAVLEAMSHGKLVIMSDIKENLELVDHSGVAYPVGNRTALRDTIAWAISDTDMTVERGQRAREVVKRLYSWDSVVERTEALYSSLVRV